jgi:hypothetical protein
MNFYTLLLAVHLTLIISGSIILAISLYEKNKRITYLGLFVLCLNIYEFLRSLPLI